MRWTATASLGLALAACGGSDAGELDPGNGQLSQQQIDSALGPGDQAAINDAIGNDALGNDMQDDGAAPANAAVAANSNQKGPE